MRHFPALLARQVRGYLYSPGFYVAMVVFLAVAGLNFMQRLAQSAQEGMGPAGMLFGSGYFWIVFLAVVSALTMPLLAEEKRSGAIETLLSAPVTDMEVVLSKYLAALMALAVICVPVLLYPWLVSTFAVEAAPADPVQLFGGWLAMMLCGAFFLALGLVVSALTRSQASAAVIGYPLMCLLFFFDYFEYAVRGASAAAVLDYLSSVRHVLDLAHGVLDTRPVFLYISGAVFLLFCAVKSLESRRFE